MSKPDRGAALAAVLWALVVGGALLTLVTILAVQEQRAAGALRREERGLVGAERVGAELAAGMTAGELRGDLPRTYDSMSFDAGGDWSALVRRLTPEVVLLEVAPRLPVGPASREAAGVRLGWLLRPRPDSVSLAAAVSVAAPVALGDGVVISGADEAPPGVDSCAASDSTIAGIAAPSVEVGGSAQVLGSPPELLQATGDLGLFERFSDRASIILTGGTYAPSPATVGTSCDRLRSTNWGDPVGTAEPCSGYLPLVRVEGDLTLGGGIGQGILLVNGNLRVTGPFTFHGMMIVKGAVDITAPTDVRGILAAAELRSGPEPVTQLKVHYSKCIVWKNLDSSAPLSPLSSRAWIPLFQAP
jgi:hypothetical protein